MDMIEQQCGWKVKLIILRGEGVPGHVILLFLIIVMVGDVGNWHRSMFFYRSFHVRVQDQAPYNDAEC